MNSIGNHGGYMDHDKDTRSRKDYVIHKQYTRKTVIAIQWLRNQN